jgi:hypothetical protein
MKTNRFPATIAVTSDGRSAPLRVLAGLACASIAALGATPTASAGNVAPANAPVAAAPANATPETIATFSLKPNGKFLPSSRNTRATRPPASDRSGESLNDRLAHARAIKPTPPDMSPSRMTLQGRWDAERGLHELRLRLVPERPRRTSGEITPRYIRFCGPDFGRPGRHCADRYVRSRLGSTTRTTRRLRVTLLHAPLQRGVTRSAGGDLAPQCVHGPRSALHQPGHVGQPGPLQSVTS